jgi:primosomal protein N' (replication factor Y)
MYEAEIAYRRKLSYPPFGRLVRLTLAEVGREHALGEAARFANQLRSEIDRQGIPNLDVLGPAPALVPRIRGRWRWNIVLRGSDPASLVAGIDLPRGWTVDVDPVSIA